MSVSEVGTWLVGFVFIVGVWTIVGWMNGTKNALIAHQKAKAEAVSSAAARAASQSSAVGGGATVVVAPGLGGEHAVLDGGAVHDAYAAPADLQSGRRSVGARSVFGSVGASLRGGELAPPAIPSAGVHASPGERIIDWNESAAAHSGHDRHVERRDGGGVESVVGGPDGHGPRSNTGVVFDSAHPWFGDVPTPAQVQAEMNRGHNGA